MSVEKEVPWWVLALFTLGAFPTLVSITASIVAPTVNAVFSAELLRFVFGADQLPWSTAWIAIAGFFAPELLRRLLLEAIK